jgi:glyoxylase-like metal-dependent hydrolase (beta-lactamase superfamily II)
MPSCYNALADGAALNILIDCGIDTSPMELALQQFLGAGNSKVPRKRVIMV